MGISLKQLEEEKAALQFTFDQLNMKIKKIEGETQNMRNNLNAVHGALQQVDKLIKADDNFGKDDVLQGRLPDDHPHPENVNLEIQQKEEPQQLNEGDK